MVFNCCRLIPDAPLHLGEREYWREGSSVFVHSDTLFSGICHCYRLLYNDKEFEEFITSVQKENIFRISSVFPFWEDVYYWPVPKNQIPKDKNVYRVQFIEHKGFEQLLAGVNIEDLIVQNTNVIPRNEEPFTPWILENVPRINLNRFSNMPNEDAGFFHSGRVTYLESAGLFFLYNIQDATIEKRFKAAIRMLADEGIGGDRSCGNGLMKQPDFVKINLNLPEPSDAFVLLSLYYPSKNDDLKAINNNYYELLERKGYIYSPLGKSLRRKSLRMFTEGSVFTAQEKYIGEVKDIKPEIFNGHPIYRYGLFWGLPCKKEVT